MALLGLKRLDQFVEEGSIPLVLVLMEAAVVAFLLTGQAFPGLLHTVEPMDNLHLFSEHVSELEKGVFNLEVLDQLR